MNEKMINKTKQTIYRPQKHCEPIDILKGMAMIMVILVHSGQAMKNLNVIIFNGLKIGQFGCQIFFFCSGYLIMNSYHKIKNDYQEDNNRKVMQKFLCKRYSSLVPGYYLILFFTLAINTITIKMTGDSIGYAINNGFFPIVCNLLLVHGFLPFCNNNVVVGGWYIGTTIILYWLTPMIYSIMMKEKNKRYTIFIPLLFASCSWGIAVIIAMCGYETVYNNNGFYYFNVLTQLPSYMLGCILWTQKNSDPALMKIKTKRKMISYTLLGIIMLLGAVICYWLGHQDRWLIFMLVMPTMFTYGIYFIFVNINLNSRIENKSAFHKSVIWYGKNSYYIYLTHLFFAWTMPGILFKVFEDNGVMVNGTLIYVLLLPIIFVGSAFFGTILKRICLLLTVGFNF